MDTYLTKTVGKICQLGAAILDFLPTHYRFTNPLAHVHSDNGLNKFWKGINRSTVDRRANTPVLGKPPQPFLWGKKK